MPRNEALKIYRDGREECLNTAAGKREYKSRLEQMVIRQHYRDPITNEYIETFTAQFDHQAGRGHGGGHRDYRIVLPDGTWQNAALSAKSNSLKGSKRYHWVGNSYVPNIREVQEAA